MICRVFIKSADEYNAGKDRLLICTKKLHPVVSERFIGDTKLNISLVFITQSSYIKDMRLKIFNKFQLIIYQILALKI